MKMLHVGPIYSSGTSEKMTMSIHGRPWAIVDQEYYPTYAQTFYGNPMLNNR